jgi:hypothetical protein
MNNSTSIIYHIGAPFTDSEQLTWSLRQDNQMMVDNGVMIRRPKEYRVRIKEMLAELQGDIPSVVDQERLLASITKKQEFDRLILSDPTFMGSPVWMFFGGSLYPNVAKNTAAIRNLFPDNPCEFYLGISNLTSFVPAAFKAQNKKDYAQFIDGTDLFSVRWSEVIQNIQKAVPGCPVTVWCNEDTPIIWPTILREFAGLDSQTRLKGELDIMRNIMSETSFKLLIKYLDERPKLTEIQRRRIRVIFLEKFALEEAIEEEIDLPGWTEETIDRLTETYEEDVDQIQRLPGVNFISP